MMQKLSAQKGCPKPIRLSSAEVNVTLDGKRHRVLAPAIVMEHVRYPQKAFDDYVHGKPYDWNALDQKKHPEHNPDGAIRFKKLLGKMYRRAGLSPRKDNVKLGNIVYCMKHK